MVENNWRGVKIPSRDNGSLVKARGTDRIVRSSYVEYDEMSFSVDNLGPRNYPPAEDVNPNQDEDIKKELSDLLDAERRKSARRVWCPRVTSTTTLKFISRRQPVFVLPKPRVPEIYPYRALLLPVSLLLTQMHESVSHTWDYMLILWCGPRITDRCPTPMEASGVDSLTLLFSHYSLVLPLPYRLVVLLPHCPKEPSTRCWVPLSASLQSLPPNNSASWFIAHLWNPAVLRTQLAAYVALGVPLFLQIVYCSNCHVSCTTECICWHLRVCFIITSACFQACISVIDHYNNNIIPLNAKCMRNAWNFRCCKGMHTV